MLLTKFKEYIQAHQLFSGHHLLLVAVSGGVDSVVLCELCRQAGFNFVMAHCNFNLRGQESEGDERFVIELARRYSVPVAIKHFDTAAAAASQKKSIETTARELRYAWFNALLSGEEGADADNSFGKNVTPQWILTAHHADDNIETVVMNFFRGTGISGIRGMQPRQGKLVRPLLFAERKDIIEFASRHALSYVTDSSNLQNEYSRNLFRNKILPLVNDVYPAASKNVLNNISRFTETEILYQQAIAQHRKKLEMKKGNEVHIPVKKLLKTEPLKTVLYEMIKDAGFTAHQTNDAIELLHSESGKYIQSPTHRLIRNRQWLILAPHETVAAAHILVEGAGRYLFAGGQLKVEDRIGKFDTLPKEPTIACLDADLVKFPLLLRRWKQGDYFYPLGMQKKKKLSRFFIDQKLSLVDKENAWVVEMNQKIVWVAGMRIDDRFKVSANTKNLLVLSLLGA